MHAKKPTSLRSLVAQTPARALACAVLAAAACAVRADPGYYVVTAYDNEGVVSVDTRYWTVKSKGEPATLWPEIGIGVGVNSRWTTELFASFIGTRDTAQKLSSWHWQNDVLLTQGQYPFDLAVHASLIRNEGYEPGYAIEMGPVLQTEIGRLQINGNVFFEREFPDDGPAEPTQMKYQWQLRYHAHPLLNPGLQGFGELGTWDDWDACRRQSHRAGPALFGTWRIAPGHALQYQAAMLFGRVYGQTGTMFSMRVLYAF